MFNNEEEKKENALGLLKILVVIFFVTYVLWYFGGGPQRWNKKFEGEVNSQEIKENFFNSNVIIKK